MKKAILFLVVFFLLPTNIIRASESDLLISEIMYDVLGGDSGQEWIEIFNSGPEAVEVLTGASNDSWRFFDGSNHIINLHQGTTTIGAGKYFLVAQDAENLLTNHPNITVSVFDTVMSLKNSSSSLGFSFDGGESYQLEDFYDSAWGAGGNGYSLEKINLLQATSSVNWQESAVMGGSPGVVNSEGQEDDLPEEDEESDDVDDKEDETEEEYLPPSNTNTNNEEPDNSRDWKNIIISEFIPNPVGSDSEEWIELYNKGQKTIDLSGFSLQDNSTHLFTFDEDNNSGFSIGPESFLVLDKSITKISLNNTGGDSVKLYDPDGELLDSVEYQGSALEGKSFALDNNNFVWTGESSPGSVNIFVANLAPVAKILLESEVLLVGEKIILSAKGSYDPEEGKLDYIWDFGDEKNGDEKVENHVFESPGSYKVNLKVIDSEDLYDQASIILKIEDKEADIKLIEVQSIDFEMEDLIISEFIPNPVGSDDTEWIEIYNNLDQDINLLGWQLDDQDGGSKPYTIEEDLVILPKSFLVIHRADSKITLNNGNDAVRLLTPLGEVWQEVSYQKIPEGKSQAWDFANQEWFEAIPSPGSTNIFLESLEPEYIYSVWESQEFDKGDDILVQGIVLQDVRPNSASLYLADWDGQYIDYNNIAEIYFHYKKFPDLEKGQVVTVSGEISRSGTLPRIKIKKVDQIWPNDIKIELPEPEILELEDISEEYFDSWQKIRGIVVKKSGKNIYLAMDKEDEALLRIYNKYPDKKTKIAKGQELIASGILEETDNLAKLTVFDVKNILVSQEVLGEKIEVNMGKITSSPDEGTEYKIIKKNDNKLTLFVLLSALILILIYFITKRL